MDGGEDLFAIGSDDDDDLLELGDFDTGRSSPPPVAEPGTSSPHDTANAGSAARGEEDELDAIFSGATDDHRGEFADLATVDRGNAAAPAEPVSVPGAEPVAPAASGDVDSLDELDDLFDLGDDEAGPAPDLTATPVDAAAVLAAEVTGTAAADTQGSTTQASSPSSHGGANAVGDGESNAVSDVEAPLDAGPPPILSVEVNQTLVQQVTQRSEAALRRELESDYPDMAAIHDAARVCGVPGDLRATVWPWLLGVQQSNDTDPAASWKGKLDLPNQSALRVDCQALLKSLKRRGLLESIEVDADTMESLLTMYCKRRAVPYQFVLAKILVAFCLACKTPARTFNCFYAFCQEYVPSLFADAPAGGSNRTRCRHLRNLVMFFDPALATHLSKLQQQWWLPAAHGGTVPGDWLDLQFASVGSPEALCAIWDAVMSGHTDGGGDFGCFIAASVLIRERGALLAVTTAADVAPAMDGLARRALVLVAGAHKAGALAVVKLARDMHRMVPPSARQPESMPDDPSEGSATPAGGSPTKARAASIAAAPPAGAGAGGGAGKGSAGAGSRTRPRSGSASSLRGAQRGRPKQRGEPPQPAAGDCLVVSAAASVPQLCLGRKALKSPTRNNGYVPMRYIVVDCRSVAQRRAGRFATAFHVDPATCVPRRKVAAKAKVAATDDGTGGRAAASALSAEGVSLDECVRQLASTRGSVYICVMGAGVWHCRGAYRPNVLNRAIELDDAAIVATVRRFQRAGFPYVCSMRGGFAGAFRVMQEAPEFGLASLVDFNPERCACTRHDRLVAYLRKHKAASSKGSSFTVGALLNRPKRRGSKSTPDQSKRATPPRAPASATQHGPRGAPPVPSRARSSSNSAQLAEAKARAAAAAAKASAAASHAAQGAKGWFRRMSRSAADTTKRLESKYSREVQQASTSMSGRMAALTAKVKKSFQDRREDAPAPAAAVAAAPAAATDTYAIAGDSDSDEELTPEERALRAEERRQRKEREEAETARAMLALELAGLAPGVDYDLTKWDGTARIFPCKVEHKGPLSSRKLQSRYIALSKDRLLVLEAHHTKLRHAIVRSNHHLTELAKLKYHASAPHRLVIYFQRMCEGAQAALQAQVFHVDDAKALIQALMTYTKAFR